MKTRISIFSFIGIISIIILFDITHGIGLNIPDRLALWWHYLPIINTLRYIVVVIFLGLWELTQFSGLLALNVIIWAGTVKLLKIMSTWKG